MTLLEYIQLPREWQWGHVDCTTWVSDWVEAKTGCDPAADLRGIYHTAAEANTIIASYGGIAGLVGSKLEPLGFRRVQTPQDGDIGIVRTMTGFDADGAVLKEIPAIRFGPLWAVMSARGPQVKALEFTGTAWGIV